MKTFRDIVEAADSPSSIIVTKVEYDKKDLDRANGITDAKKAKLMADKITDAEKMVKRAKAVMSVHPDKPELVQPFLDGMKRLGFSDDKISAVSTSVKASVSISVNDLPLPVHRNGTDYKPSKIVRGRSYVIMNASIIYKGKLSTVIPEAASHDKTVILLGIANPYRMPGQEDKPAKGSPIAIVGSASGMEIDENGLDYYQIPKSGWLNYIVDTGNGYREPQSDIMITGYVLCENGKALTKYVDKSYKYYVFK
jgi:hypothetical protein